MDACAGGTLARALREDGHDVVDLLESGGADESARPAAMRRVLITIDKDFGEAILHCGKAHVRHGPLAGLCAPRRPAVFKPILLTPTRKTLQQGV